MTQLAKTIALTAVLAVSACGGLEDDRTGTRSDRLTPAPSWVADLDLAGCDCLPAALRGPGHAWQLLGYPGDPSLVVGVVDGEPACVGTPQDALQAMDPSEAQAWSGLGAQLLPDRTAQQGPDDDPVPIRGGDEAPPEDDDDDSGGETRIVGGTTEDDPVPIRELPQPTLLSLPASR